MKTNQTIIPLFSNTNLPGTINLFVNSRCNYTCKHCYATFQDIPGAKLPKLCEADAMAIIQQIADEPLADNLVARKITFVGGEPTLHPALPRLVAFAKQSGLVTAVITNGLTASPRYLEQFAGNLDWVGLSIDGLNKTLNQQIGRATTAGRYLDGDSYLARIQWIKDIGARLKINTVVSALNQHSDFNEFMRQAQPMRWKIFQVTPIAGQNDRFIKLLEIQRSAFDQFVARHSMLENRGIRVVAEPVETIRGSYVMISPDGRFFDDSEGCHYYSNRILDVGLSNAFNEVAFDAAKYDGRDGNYNPFTGQSQTPTLQQAA